MIGRREFISLLGGAVAAWPLTARAQQGERMRRIGMLIPLNADDKVAQDRIAVFVQGLKELGGNLTGVSNLNVELGSKQLELMHELVPTALSSLCSVAWPQWSLYSRHQLLTKVAVAATHGCVISPLRCVKQLTH